MHIGFTEILLIIVFVLLVFGAKRIPELAKALGRASHEYKKAKENLRAESEELIAAAEQKAAAEDAAKETAQADDK